MPCAQVLENAEIPQSRSLTRDRGECELAGTSEDLITRLTPADGINFLVFILTDDGDHVLSH